MAEHVLIVEDENKIASVLQDYLHKSGYTSAHLDRGDVVLPWMRQHRTDLVLLDLMLPGLDGLEVCKALRRETQTAIVMVTARVDELDRLLGLELGADDYICKPFSPREVVARVKAVLRRRRPDAAEASCQSLLLDPLRLQARLDGVLLELTALEFKLLQVLSQQPGRIFSRDQLMDAIYRDERVVADRTVDSHVKKLRRKIDEARPGRVLIQSVYGAGYKFEPDP